MKDIGAMTNEELLSFAQHILDELNRDDVVKAVKWWARQHVEDGYRDELIAALEEL